MISSHTYPTPAGGLTVLARRTGGPAAGDAVVIAAGDAVVIAAGDAVVIAAGFCPSADLIDRLPGVGPDDVRPADGLGPLDDPIGRYLDGDVTALDEVRVDQAGTELQRAVWAGLRAIPAGQTRTYTELAEASGRPRAVRAVGSACGRNLIAPFVPCHRALRSDGSLGGYYYGLDVKRWLLAHESDRPASS
jgi:methylated-DNA-[protein]-cysteine S-methyltransferase